jgi:flagellar biosynthesis/type III secretory pathway M-ring protein FliF/YscJ
MLSPELLREIMLYVAIVAAVLFSYFTIIRPLIYGVDLAEKKRLEEEVKAVQIEAEEARNNFSVTIDKSQREIERLQQEAKRASEARDAEENVRREAAMTDKQRYENLLTEVKTYAASNPEDMAVLAKAWLSEDTPPPDTTSKKRGFA